MIQLADQAVTLGQGVLEGIDQAHVLHRRGCGAGDDLELGELGGGELADFGPIGSDGGDGRFGPHGGHHQAAHEGGTIGVVWNAVVGVDVGHYGRAAVLHRPAGDAVMHREAAAFPEGADRVFVEIEALIAVAHDDGHAVGAADPAGHRQHHRGDTPGRAGGRQLLDGFDQGRELAAVRGRRLLGRHVQKSGHPLSPPLPRMMER